MSQKIVFKFLISISLFSVSTFFPKVFVLSSTIHVPSENNSTLSSNPLLAQGDSSLLEASGPGDPYSMEDLASKEKVIIVVNNSMTLPFFLDKNHQPHYNHHQLQTSNIPKSEEVISGEEEDDEELDEDEEEDEDEEGISEDDKQSQTGNVAETTEESGVHVAENVPENLQETFPATTPSPPTRSEPSQPHPQIVVQTDRVEPRPQPVKAQFDEELDEKLFLILQDAVRETYFSFRDILGNRHRTQMKTLEDDLRAKLHQLDVDMNVKIVALDTTTHSRIQILTDQIIDQRKEDIQTFSDNLHQLQKTHQMHMDSQKVEIQQLQVTLDLLNKGQSSLATKLSQLQKVVNNLDSKINEIVIKTSEDLNGLRDGQKLFATFMDEIQLDLKTSDAEFKQIQQVVSGLQRSANEDHGKLRRTLIRDQKQEPLQLAIRHLKNKNIGAAVKQWRSIESIADDLKETLPSDISKIIEDSYSKNGANLATMSDFIHRAMAQTNDKRLKETAYSSLLSDTHPRLTLADAKKTVEIFNLAQVMKADLGQYYNSSAVTTELVSRLPSIIKLITFDKVRLLLPTRGYLRVASDRKVTLVPQDGRFYEKEEILWQFEYDKNNSDGTFYIKSDKLQKYLVTLQEGFNAYGFSKQGLFVTGNKRENGTRFQITIVNQGEYVLFKSVYYNGYLTWKSNVQTVYGDDDSYFLLLVDRKNGPSPYWNILPENGDD